LVSTSDTRSVNAEPQRMLDIKSQPGPRASPRLGGGVKRSARKEATLKKIP
jgi:hypothetical protein